MFKIFLIGLLWSQICCLTTADWHFRENAEDEDVCDYYVIVKSNTAGLWTTTDYVQVGLGIT